MTLVRPIVDPLNRTLVQAIGAGSGVTIDQMILPLYAPGVIQGLYLAIDSTDYVTVASGAVATWIDKSGTGWHATQGTGSVRPAWVQDSGKWSLQFDGTDALATAARDLTTKERIFVMLYARDTIASVCIPADFAGVTAGRCALVLNDAAGTAATYGRVAAGNIEARSAGAAAPLTTYGVVTGSVDYTLAADAAEIFLNGTNVTSTRPSNPDASAATVANAEFTIGNRSAADLGLTGFARAVVIGALASADAFPLAAMARTAEILVGGNW